LTGSLVREYDTVFLSKICKRGYFNRCRSEDTDLPRNSAAGWLLPGVALLFGVLGMTAIWVSIAVISNRSCSWLALVTAIDMAVLLRLTNAPEGSLRTLVATFATALAVALSLWFIVATQLGFAFGLLPVASAIRLGPALAWQLSKLSLDRVDMILLLASLPLAAILSQARKAKSDPLSAPRPGP